MAEPDGDSSHIPGEQRGEALGWAIYVRREGGGGEGGELVGWLDVAWGAGSCIWRVCGTCLHPSIPYPSSKLCIHT